MTCLETPMDGGAWSAAVQVVAKGRTGLLYERQPAQGKGWPDFTLICGLKNLLKLCVKTPHPKKLVK